MDRLDFFLVFALGIYILALFGQNFLFGVLGLGLCLIILNKYRVLGILLLMVSIRLFVYLNYETGQLDVYSDNGVSYKVVGRICNEPDIRLDSIKYHVCVQDLVHPFNGSEPDLKSNVRLLVDANLYPQYFYGDLIQFTAKIEKPFETEEFSYANYLKIFKISAVAKNPYGLKILESSSSFRKSIYSLKSNLMGIVDSNLNEPYASLINGLLFGSRKGFSDEITNRLSLTGLTHIVAVSGYNVSLVILFVDKLLFFLPRNFKIYPMLFFLVCFAILTGLSASVMRAVIMGSISVMVMHYEYSNDFVRAILIAANLMIFLNPATIYYDVGFQLSFFATLGVVYLSKNLSFNFLPSILGIRESFTLTVASQIATLPTIIYYFGALSLISPIANVLVAPFLPVLMLLGFMLILLSNIIYFKWIIIILTDFLCSVFFVIIDFCSKVPYGFFQVPVKRVELLILSFVLVIGVIFYGFKKSTRNLKS